MLAEWHFSWEAWLEKSPQRESSVCWQMFALQLKFPVSLAISMDALNYYRATITTLLCGHSFRSLGLDISLLRGVQPPLGPLKVISPSEGELI